MHSKITDKRTNKAPTTNKTAIMVLELDNIPIHVIEHAQRKQARAVYRHNIITVHVPQAWPLDLKASSCLNLAKRILKKHRKNQQLIDQLPTDTQWLTLHDDQQLSDYIQQVNKATLQALIKGSRIGRAKLSRLAQINLKNRIITVSPYCLHHVPEPALRYLIIHELAHTRHADHSHRFWHVVAQYMPQYKYWSDVIEAIHTRNST